MTCDDEDACNGLETCDSATGDCVAGTPVVCDDEDACNGLESCDPTTGDCVAGTPVVCDDENVCNGTESCDPTTGDCVPGETLDCGDGELCTYDFCDPITGCYTVDNTEPCDDGDPCTDGDVCAEGQCGWTTYVCPESVCDDLVDDDFDGATDCDDDDCAGDPACVPPCAEDTFEDNDTLDSAAAVAAGSYADLRICPDDDDYYSLALAVGDEIAVDLMFANAEGDIDLGLYNPEGTLVASSASTDDDESLVYTAAIAGTFVIRVRLYADAGSSEGNDYGMVIGIVPVSGCAEDGYEDNDALGSAAALTAGSYADLRICPDDDDYYSLALAVGDEITVDLMFANAEGDIDLGLYNPEGTLVASSASTDDDESLVYTAAIAGTFVVRVRLYEDAGVAEGNDYDMTIGVVPFTGCLEDGFEDNDALASAAAVDEGDYTGLRICPSDDDYYSLALNVGDEITVDLTFANAEGDIDLGLYNPEGTLVASSASTDDNESLVYTAAIAGTFVVRVRLYADAGAVEGNTYGMDIGVVPAVTCADDGFEDNDAVGSPAAIDTGSYANLRACPDDDDYYSLSLNAGDRIAVGIAFSQAEGDLDLALFNPEGTIVASSATTDDNEVLTYTAVIAGTFVIWVNFYEELGSVTGNDYTLDVDVISPAR